MLSLLFLETIPMSLSELNYKVFLMYKIYIQRFLKNMVSTILLTGCLVSNVYSAGESSPFQFKNVDIGLVIESVSKATGKRFVVDPRVKGKVNFISSEPIDSDSLYQSFLSILAVHNYIAVEDEAVVKILPAGLARSQVGMATKDSLNDDWVTEVLSVKFIDSGKLVSVLRPLVARDGHLSAISKSNKLVISDTKSNIKRIKSVLKKTDIDYRDGMSVIDLEYSTVDEVIRTIKELLPDSKVVLSPNFRTNRIIAMGDKDELIKVRALITSIDVPSRNLSGVQVVYLKHAKASDLLPIVRNLAKTQVVEKASKPQSTKDSSGKPLNISIEADERMNALIFTGSSSSISMLQEIVKKLDIKRAQVLIEAVFVEVSEEKASQLGVEWGLGGSSGAVLTNFSGIIPNILGNSGDVAAQSKSIGRGLSLGGLNLNTDGSGWGAFITALRSDSSSNILATPSIMTLDNEKAEIIVGKEVPFQTGSYTSTNSSVSNPFSTIERKSVGLKLKVKPQINENGDVYLDIDQEVSDVLPKGEAVDLQTTKRGIKTKVVVTSGKTIVLGGLINEKEVNVDSDVPGLADIPGIGGLFGSTDGSHEKTNLMVFLRPVIIRDDKDSDYHTNLKYGSITKVQNSLNTKSTFSYLGESPRLTKLNQPENNTIMPKKIVPVETPDSFDDNEDILDYE